MRACIFLPKHGRLWAASGRVIAFSWHGSFAKYAPQHGALLQDFDGGRRREREDRDRLVLLACRSSMLCLLNNSAFRDAGDVTEGTGGAETVIGIGTIGEAETTKMVTGGIGHAHARSGGPAPARTPPVIHPPAPGASPERVSGTCFPQRVLSLLSQACLLQPSL